MNFKYFDIIINGYNLSSRGIHFYVANDTNTWKFKGN